MSSLSPSNLEQDEYNSLSTFVQSLRILSEKINSIILKSSVKGILNYVSPNVKKILGYDSNEMIGYRLFDFLHDNDKGILSKELINVPEEEHIVTLRFRKKDGLFLWVELTANLIIDGMKMPKEVLYTIHEIPVKELETNSQNGKLSLIGQLAAGIAHEIRNPLTSIKGFIQLMKSDKNINSRYLEIMENEIDRIDSISNELMILARPSHTNYKLYDLKNIFESCLTLMETQAAQKQINFVRICYEKPILVYCDEQKIKQVIINLLKNALEAMEEPGQITVKIKKENGFGKLVIRDEGIGIPKDLIDKLGEPFFTTKTNGNGLGLMMTYRIIEEHKGKMEVESELEKGSTFSVYLPTKNTSTTSK